MREREEYAAHSRYQLRDQGLAMIRKDPDGWTAEEGCNARDVEQQQSRWFISFEGLDVVVPSDVRLGYHRAHTLYFGYLWNDTDFCTCLDRF